MRRLCVCVPCLWSFYDNVRYPLFHFNFISSIVAVQSEEEGKGKWNQRTLHQTRFVCKALGAAVRCTPTSDAETASAICDTAIAFRLVRK